MDTCREVVGWEEESLAWLGKLWLVECWGVREQRQLLLWVWAKEDTE